MAWSKGEQRWPRQGGRDSWDSSHCELSLPSAGDRASALGTGGQKPRCLAQTLPLVSRVMPSLSQPLGP